MKKLMLLPLVLIVSNTAFSANWVKIGENSVVESTHYIDTYSIKKVNSYLSQQVRYFTKTDYAKAKKTTNGKYYNYDITQWKNDCTNEKKTILAIAFYTADGNVVNSASSSYDDWSAVYPDSLGSEMMKLACSYVGY
ncbi:hypothetical protein B8W92_05645 [Moraxella osloensis]|nr:surface-adhesin E family protein [Moraxella osloensis]PAL16175.1 hypothetical protein B8W92_05645 [Moraxella osloensis]